MKMVIGQLGCVGVIKGGDLSSEEATEEGPCEINKGTEEDTLMEGKQGAWLPAFQRLSWEVSYSRHEALEGHQKPGGRVTERQLWLSVRTFQRSDQWKELSQRVTAFHAVAGGSQGEAR